MIFSFYFIIFEHVDFPEILFDVSLRYEFCVMEFNGKTKFLIRSIALAL